MSLLRIRWPLIAGRGVREIRPKAKRNPSQRSARERRAPSLPDREGFTGLTSGEPLNPTGRYILVIASQRSAREQRARSLPGRDRPEVYNVNCIAAINSRAACTVASWQGQKHQQVTHIHRRTTYVYTGTDTIYVHPIAAISSSAACTVASWQGEVGCRQVHINLTILIRSDR